MADPGAFRSQKTAFLLDVIIVTTVQRINDKWARDRWAWHKLYLETQI